MSIIHVENFPFIQSLGTRITSRSRCGCSSLQFTASPVRVQISTAAIATNPKLLQVREPLDKIDPSNQHLDLSETVLYVLALSFSLDSEPFLLLFTCTLTESKLQTTSKLVDYHSLPVSLSYVPFVTDLQAAPFCILAFILILELREPPYRCSFHDCICSSGHRIEFDGKHGRTGKVSELSGLKFCLPADLVSLDLLIVTALNAQHIS